ncbi:LINE-1 reverse transcriptase like, partial [Trifolium medium]|nr:LINE-1 reverse transcriptase like [Trifolium medium]
GFVLKEKLKRLKGDLRSWNKDVYGNIDTKIDDLTKEIESLELGGEREGLSEYDLLDRKDKFNLLWLLLKSKDSMEFQKSRSRWLREGDANTGFFHVCVKSRKRSNSIVTLRKGRFWLTRPEEIRSEVVSYFRNHFEEVEWKRPRLDDIDFIQPSHMEVVNIEESFRVTEVSEVIELADVNKSPGPDGFNFSKSFGVLSPHQLGDFRPISLLGSLCKLLSKVLAKRLGKVMDSIISKNQSAFIKGRNLADGVVTVNEVVDLAKRAKKERLIFKVDFEKAYDSKVGGVGEWVSYGTS